jgi:hypothetical protein
MEQVCRDAGIPLHRTRCQVYDVEELREKVEVHSKEAFSAAL